MEATSQQSGSSVNGARFGRRCVSVTAPVSASVLRVVVVRLIAPNARMNAPYATRSFTWAAPQGWFPI